VKMEVDFKRDLMTIMITIACENIINENINEIVNLYINFTIMSQLCSKK
jgi:hypothetical protein